MRSFPSRVRSPTPAKTEYPLCPLAILLMSSMISTVFPTPAPPKSPILPPFIYGSSRSMTLIPVASISLCVERSSNFGASRWIGYAPSMLRGSIPSIGCPMTFIIRPLICSPAGITIGEPVCFTTSPRCSPSVLSIATQRTVSSPICCCTSTTSSRPSGRSILRAS